MSSACDGICAPPLRGHNVNVMLKFLAFLSDFSAYGHIIAKVSFKILENLICK